MSKQARVTIEGFSLTEARDTATHEVEIGTIEDGGTTFVLEMIRSKQNSHLNFLLASVSAGSKPIWTYRKSGWQGFGLLAMTDYGLVIACVDQKMVTKVAPFAGFRGQRLDLYALIGAKKQAAKFLDMGYVLTQAENTLVTRDARRIRESEAAAKQAAHEAREKAREEFVRTLLGRPRITAYTSDGRSRNGIPVLESEWQRATSGTFVILVDTIGEGGEPGNPLEAFQVQKGEGRHPTKGGKVLVTADRPALLTKEPEKAVTPLREIVVETEDGIFPALVYASMDVIREARDAGLNSGTLVTTGERLKDNRVVVYAVHHDRVDTIGHCEVVE